MERLNQRRIETYLTPRSRMNGGGGGGGGSSLTPGRPPLPSPPLITTAGCFQLGRKSHDQAFFFFRIFWCAEEMGGLGEGGSGWGGVGGGEVLQERQSQILAI